MSIDDKINENEAIERPVDCPLCGKQPMITRYLTQCDIRCMTHNCLVTSIIFRSTKVGAISAWNSHQASTSLDKEWDSGETWATMFNDPAEDIWDNLTTQQGSGDRPTTEKKQALDKASGGKPFTKIKENKCKRTKHKKK